MFLYVNKVTKVQNSSNRAYIKHPVTPLKTKPLHHSNNKYFSLAVPIFSLSLFPISKLTLEMFEPSNDYIVNQPMCPRKLENYFGIVHYMLVAFSVQLSSVQ